MEILEIGIVVLFVASIVMMVIALLYETVRKHKPFVWTLSQILMVTVLMAFAKLAILAYQGINTFVPWSQILWNQNPEVLFIANLCWLVIILFTIIKGVVDGYSLKEL